MERAFHNLKPPVGGVGFAKRYWNPIWNPMRFRRWPRWPLAAPGWWFALRSTLTVTHTRRCSLTSETPTRLDCWSSSCARLPSRRPTDSVYPGLHKTAAVSSSMSLMNIKLESNHDQASCSETEVGMGSTSTSEKAQEFGGDHDFRRSQVEAQRESTGEREQQAMSSRPAHGSNAPGRRGGTEANRGCHCRPRDGSAPNLGVAAGGTRASNYVFNVSLMAIVGFILMHAQTNITEYYK